ncbi:MAG: hydroxymethylglutaryl-CoA reductase [Candidatus Thorarchaeota archaeon]|nr:hydroxymethylglutaryl-CoA reductase [Candidatus Thorarchaeota archaeon]
MKIPPSILKRLYVKGSLENSDDGFSFKIKNALANGTAVSMSPVKIDGTEYPLDATTIKTGGSEIPAAEVSADNPAPIKVGVEVVIHVKADPLPEGTRKIGIALETKEIGEIAFEVDDEI